MTGILIRRGTSVTHGLPQREDHWENMAVYPARREDSGGTNSADIWISDLSPQDFEEIEV